MKTKKSSKMSRYLHYFGFGIGAVGMDLSYGLFNSYLTKYFTDVLFLDATFLLIVPALARIWDGINDPMMGMIVDNTRSRFGKFRPWILTGSILNAVALTLLFTNPGLNPHTVQIYCYAAIMYVLWGMTNTLVDIPYWSIVPALTSDPQERNIVSAIPRLFSGGGQLIVSVMTVIMVEKLGKGNDGLGYSRWAMISGIVLILGSVITVLSIKEVGSAPPKEKFTLKKAFQTVKNNDQLLIFMVTAILFNTGWYITNALGIFFFDDVLGNKKLISVFSAVCGVGQALGLVLLPVLAKKFTRRKVIQGAMIVSIIGYLGMFVFGRLVNVFAVFVVFGLLGCMGIGCMFVAQTAMLADIVDYGEFKLHYRSESIVFSMKGFLQKLAYTVQSIVIALGLKIGAYDGALLQQSQLAKDTICVMMFIIPPILVAASYVIFTKKYKLYGKLSEEVTAFIEARSERATAEKQ